MKFLSYLFGAFLLVACSVQNSDNGLRGNEYKMIDAPHDAEITIGFSNDGKQFFGSAGVNRYFGDYKLKGDKLVLNNVGLTMMMGPEELMAAESEFLKFLENVQSFKLDGSKLTLNGKDKSIEFDFLEAVKD